MCDWLCAERAMYSQAKEVVSFQTDKAKLEVLYTAGMDQLRDTHINLSTELQLFHWEHITVVLQVLLRLFLTVDLQLQ